MTTIIDPVTATVDPLAILTPTGLPVPALADEANVPSDMNKLALALDSVTVPVFATTAARDAAITAGAKFNICMVAGTPYRLKAGAWVRLLDTADIYVPPTTPPFPSVLTTGAITGCAVPAGGGTLGWASGLVVAAQPYPQVVTVYAAALCTILSAAGGALIIRDAASTSLAIASWASPNSSNSVFHTFRLAANTAAVFNAVGNHATGAVTLTSDARWAKFWALAIPSV